MYPLIQLRDKNKMSIGKSNRCREYMKEIEHIEYEYLSRKIGLSELHRRFYEHRVQLLESHILNYLNTTDET